MATRTKSAASKAETEKINRRVLMVAIDDYPGNANDLSSCVADAEAMVALLKSAPYNFEEIQTYTNEQATVANVKAGLEWLLGSAVSEHDRLVLFFSGHGFRPVVDGEHRECLCLYDGYLFDEELAQLTQTLPPAILTILLDCCHAGGMEKNFVLGDTRIKTFFPDDPQELTKTFAPSSTSLPIKPFGRATLLDPSAPASKALMAAGPQANGLIITACQPEQVALAGSAKTEGKSAFTYSLLEALETLGATAEVSNRQLFDQTSAILKSLQFEQIPVLHEPPNAPGLQDKSFITLQPTSALKDCQAPAFSGSLIEPTEIKHKGAPIMSTIQFPTQFPALNLNRPLTEADAQFCTDVIKYSLQVMPMMLQSINQQDSKANGQQPIDNSKFWGLAVAAISAVPYIVGAIQGKNWETESDAPIAEDKLWAALVGAVVGVIPGIINAASKGTTDSKNLNRPLTEADAQYCTEVIKCSLKVMPTMLQAVNQQDSKANGQQPIDNSKGNWAHVIPGLLGGIPSLIDLIRGKNWKIESDAPIAEEKFWANVLGATIGAIPATFDDATKGATDSKNFAPQESSAASGIDPLPAPASNGAASAEVDEELVDAVMTRLADTLMAAR
ncbi:MAG: caspase family protein [Cyanobacteria bacterium CAN_BIN43]|nr:caspase family protein [Cyanobacteria bacterium CAN_BIN43]